MAHNTAEPDVAHACVDHLWLPCRWTITKAVVGRAEVRTAFDHLPWNPELRLRCIVAFGGREDARIDSRAATGLDYFVGMVRDKPV